MVVEYLRNRRLNLDAPLPVVPQVQKRNMELLAEAWILGSDLKKVSQPVVEKSLAFFVKK